MIHRTRNSTSRTEGFTLVEVILVVVIIGILATVAVRTARSILETAKIEETKEELNELATAIVGNSELQNNGVRVDFGYVGDIGALPSNLDALHSNPGSFSTWRGPYVQNRFSQVREDFKRDAWGNEYVYGGSVTVTSTSAGSDIVRRLAGSADQLLYNSVSGTVLDSSGTPPGATYVDSVLLRLSFPNGIGGITMKTSTTDKSGSFSFDSIPIGNHALEIIYLPDSDTLSRFVTILPGSRPYSEYHLPTDVWSN